ncbi:hypothetical protein [Burkholderia pseudomallei]|uniref:Uncharacterized protein n=1 Tax=Burkholderia pseudomallei TaxID=28450 RepID=A0AA40JA71_BURPE|nr:hypothetical protein [Burkholderia pseudomallei]KGX73929.1 hypothetical protein Y033_1482 [Burkholderia pseudomallei MSHR435]ACQ97816.1 conserved hypothetical protein [Burkholderia pseudomallei MSHR346]AFR15039.1 hypothetical protein BPC006_I1154 [Burkholderia pseudomallei BPC006]AGR71567.1 hypothetical protein BDL_3265 [Burkholderia pseudomallei MSHR305]AHK66532.1 hypothetical protein BBX_1666 [Burkholderia pseudomallei MSHR520]
MAKEPSHTSAPLVQPRATFVDTRFRTRVIVFPDGSVLRVIKGEVLASVASHIEYLDAHPDFKRLEGRA